MNSNSVIKRSRSKAQAQKNDSEGQINFFNVFCPTNSTASGNLLDTDQQLQSTSNVASDGAIYEETLFKSDKNMRPCLKCAASHKKCEMTKGSIICAHCQKQGFICIPKPELARGKGRKRERARGSSFEDVSTERTSEQTSTPDNASVIYLSKPTYSDSNQNGDFFSMWTNDNGNIDYQ